MHMQAHPERKPLRLKSFDYSTDGAYFATICTANREHFFGEIRDKKMVPNACGKITQKCWREIPDHFPHVRIDEFVVMPNHVHGIVWIENENVTVGGGHARPLRSRKKSNLSTIIGSFKSAVSKQTHEINTTDFAWQKSFHDRIIRDDEELNRIREYIFLNPENWENDQNNLDDIQK